MATLVEQLYSQNHWAGIDGVQTIWNFTFAGGYIFPEHVKAYYLDAGGNRIDVVVTEDMLIGEFQLQVTPAIPATAQRFVIYRSTPKDLPLVDFEGGANLTEPNLDRMTKQAIFVAAEALDVAMAYVDISELGFKALKKRTYVGASTVLTADNGRAHYKTDGTSVTVPDTLPEDMLCTIINDNETIPMTVTFSDATAVMQGSENYAGKSVWTLAPRNTLSIYHAADGRWLISGFAE